MFSLSKQKIAIFGSTGSIGKQALEIVKELPERFEIKMLSANSNFKLLAEQANHFKPDTLIICNEIFRKNLTDLLIYKPKRIFSTSQALEELAEEGDYDILLNSLVGFSGFMSTYLALKNGKRVALANKESLVVGGELLTRLDGFKAGNLIPVDSEHSAMLQCLTGEGWDTIQKIIITASGGPFRDYTLKRMKNIRVEDALKHPNWDMGAKITIDSATMMNKGLEIIEAKWLFDIPVDKIEPVVHPQSIIHSIIEFVDGSSKAQLGPPDMKVPILYALTYPERIPFSNPTLNYSEAQQMEFYPVDYKRFPCIELAIYSVSTGGAAPSILNAANEIAVERFLKKEIRYIDIPEIIEKSLSTITFGTELSPSALKQIDKETRDYANTLLR